MLNQRNDPMTIPGRQAPATGRKHTAGIAIMLPSRTFDLPFSIEHQPEALCRHFFARQQYTFSSIMEQPLTSAGLMAFFS